MARLVACPFCRELFDEREVERCPDCGLPVVPLERLPPVPEALADEDRPFVPEENRPLGFWTWRYGRGPLLCLALLGAALFFAPWVTLTRADDVTLRGFDLARGNAPWLWGGALGWFLMVPLVLSRRTRAHLWGVRVIAATFAAMTAGEAALLLARPPADPSYFSYGVEYTWGLYASGLVSLVAVAVAARLGGKIERSGDKGGPAGARPSALAKDASLKVLAPEPPPDDDDSDEDDDPPSGPRVLH